MNNRANSDGLRPAGGLAGAADSEQRHLLHVFPGFSVGGSQSRFAQFVAGVPMRYRHTVISLNGKTEMARQLPAGSPVEIIAPTGLTGSGPRTWLACRRYLQGLNPDLLVTYNWGSMDWCLSNLIAPLAGHVHIEDGFGPEEAHRQLRRRVWARRVALSTANSIVVVPSRSLERIAREVWKIPAPRLQYIPNGVDLARFGRARKQMPALPKLVVGTVATLRMEKNLGRLIGLFGELAAKAGGQACELVIVGDGPERGKLEELAKQSPFRDSIRFAGATSTPELDLEKFDIFALTSDTEQMPLSVLEAMASGLPVISFAVGDVAQMVSAENREFASIALDDGAAFLQKLCLLASSAPLRAQLGQANRRRADEEFGQDLMLRRYAQLFG